MEPTVIEYWLVGDIADGAVASWVGRKKGTNLAQATSANRPTKSASGVVFDGSNDSLSGSLNLSSTSTLRVVACLGDTATTVAVAMEHTPDTNTNNGAFYLAVNNGTADTVHMAVRGTVGVGERRCPDNLATAAVWSFCADSSISTGVQWIRKSGVAQTLTTNASACAAGNFANSTLYLGSRAGTALFWPGTYKGGFAIMSGNAQDSALTRVEAYMKQQANI